MYAQKAIVHNAPTLHTVRNVHKVHCAYRFSYDCINFVRAIEEIQDSGNILSVRKVFNDTEARTSLTEDVMVSVENICSFVRGIPLFVVIAALSTWIVTLI